MLDAFMIALTIVVVYVAMEFASAMPATRGKPPRLIVHRQPFRFSLRSLLIAMTAAAVLVAVASLMSRR